jgi:transposase
MAKYKHYDYRQMKMLPVSFDRQILPGTFEHTLNELIDREVDLKVFDDRYNNDAGGAPAYDPAVLLKIILFAYSKGITSSRRIEQLCCENVVCMALSADTAPHWTTIASFISSSGDEITQIFRNVLLVCDEAGLIGKQMFAVDGVKLPSNASKEWSGTRADYSKKIEKMERAVRHLVQRHREQDASGEEPQISAARQQQIETLNAAIDKVRRFLQRHTDKVGSSGRVKKSNITDNESAKMRTNKGVVQGYDGLAMVDGKHQIIVHAEAFGEGQEHGLLIPMIEGTKANFPSGRAGVFKKATLLADAGFCSEKNIEYLHDEQIEAYVADAMFRKRDPRFKNAHHHKPTRACEPFAKPKRELKFQPKDFQLAKDLSHCICPAGKRMYCSGRGVHVSGYEALRFRAPINACAQCVLRDRCIRHPQRTRVRQVAFFLERSRNKPESHCARMKRKIDSDVGRYAYSRRLGIVEPVFGNIRHTKRLTRFTLRGKRKVEPRRLSRRLHTLRGWSHGINIETIFGRSERTSGADGRRASRGVWLAMGCDPVDRRQDRVHERSAEALGAAERA